MKFPSLRSILKPFTLSPSKGERSQQGVALVITLLVLTLLITLILEFSNTMRIEARAAANFRDDLKAYYIARAGVEFARGVLEEDKKDTSRNYDALTENWAQRLPPIPLGEGTVLVEIADEGGKINLNQLKATSGINEVFIRLLETHDIGDPQKILESVIDWLDSNSEVTGSGAETAHYEGLEDPYPVKNGPLDSLAEARLIQGMEGDAFNRLKEFLTIYGDGLININTASPQVLLALSPDWNEAVVEEIRTFQKEAPFQQKSDLREKVTGEDIYNKVQGVIDVNSSFFSIRSQGEVNGVRKTIHAVVNRTGSGAGVKTDILYWRVE